MQRSVAKRGSQERKKAPLCIPSQAKKFFLDMSGSLNQSPANLNSHTKGHRGASILKTSFAMAHEVLPEGTELRAFHMTDVFKLVLHPGCCQT